MDAELDLNFLPDDYVAARARARASRLCGTLLGIVIVGVAGAFIFAETSLHQLKTEHARVTEDFERESARLKKLDTLQKQQQAVARRASLAEALIEKTSRTALLAELNDLLPDSTSLAEVALTSKVKEIVKTPEQLLAERTASRTTKVVAEPEPKRYSVSMRIAGMSYTDVQVAQYINRLSRSRYFDDVNLLVSREYTYEGQLVRRFEVELTVRPEPLPVRPEGDPIVSTEAQLGQ